MSDSETQDYNADVDNQLLKALAEYEIACENGHTPDPVEFAKRYPQIAEALQSKLENRPRVCQLTQPLRMLNQQQSQQFPSVPGYTILKELQTGGMGVVYRANQHSLNREVALKIIRADRLLAMDNREREIWFSRLRLESEITAKIKHPNIMPIIEFGQAQDQPFFAMNLIEGGSLKEHLPQLRGQPRKVAIIVLQIARAIYAAHQSAIIHRDLKPGNILMVDDHTPLVTDFGLAKQLDSSGELTQTDNILGTIPYMAPEQALRNKPVTTAADVFGIGAILYECLTGDSPYPKDKPLANVLECMKELVPHVKQKNPTADGNLANICMRCLKMEPQERYSSAEDLAEDLVRYLKGGTIANPGGSVWTRLTEAINHREPVGEHLSLTSFLWAGILLVTAHGIIAWLVHTNLSSVYLWITAGIFYTVMLSKTIYDFHAIHMTRPERFSHTFVLGAAVSQFTLLLVFAIPEDQSTCHWILKWYPAFFIISGLGDYTHGFTHWGWFYIYGLAHMPMAVFCVYYPNCGPLLFAASCALKTVWAGYYLRKFAREYRQSM